WAVARTGPVWFLAGGLGGAATRHCTVPAGKALLMTPLTQLDGAGALDCDPTVPSVLCNVNTLRALAAAFADDPTTLEVTVDGHQVQHVGDYRVQSPVFSITYPDNNVLSFLAGTEIPSGTYTPNVSDGYWLLLAPLSAGAHTIHLKAVTNPTVGSFTVEVTWHLTITP